MIYLLIMYSFITDFLLQWTIKPQQIQYKRSVLVKRLYIFSHHLITNYLNSIFNEDEMGIFYKLTPDIIRIFRGEKSFEGKLSKERITGMLCANSLRSEKH